MFKCSIAYSMLPSTNSSTTFPATRTTNKSPIPCWKITSGITLESEQVIINASGRYVNKLIERISKNIKNEKDYDKAIELNVKAEVLNLKQAFATFKNVEFIGSIYDIETGNCIFL